MKMGVLNRSLRNMLRQRTRQLGAALALSFVVAAAPGCDGRPTPDAPEEVEQRVDRGERHVAVVDLRRGAPEKSGGGLFAGPSDRTYADLVLRLRTMADEESLAGVFVRMGAANMPLAQSEEVGGLLNKLRERKMPVICHADGYGNSGMLLAALGCSEIWLTPAGNVDTVGLAAQLMFGKSLLAKLNVDVDFLQIGDFKGASEPFTRDGPSEASRKSLKKALGGLRDSWLAGISKGRGKSAEELAVESGPFTATEALKHKLIDKVGFEHEARARALTLAETEGFSDYFAGRPEQPSGLGELLRVLASGGESAGPHIAVVVATGSITLSGGSGLGGGGGIAARQLSGTLKQVREDPDVEAVVLRIDSPGGSALASDLLWDDLMRLRKKKPLVVSVGGMAASGGYYMACAGNRIVAEPSSIIGSIGVVTGKLSFARSLQELGVHVETVAAAPDGTGQRALYASPFAPWDDGTRERMRATAQHIYDLFLQRIGEARKMERSAIEPYAAGRIMGGQHAKDAGLIDEVGGLDRALALAAELAESEPDVNIQIVRPAPALLGLLGGSQASAEAALQLELQREAQLRQTLESALGTHAHWRLALAAERFVSSYGPLLDGETTVAAMPFALRVE